MEPTHRLHGVGQTGEHGRQQPSCSPASSKGGTSLGCKAHESLLPSRCGCAGAAATRGRQDIAQRMELAEGRSRRVENPHLCRLWLCCGSPGKGCKCGAWPQVGVRWRYKLWVMRGINAAQVMLGVPSSCKAGGEVSRCPGNVSWVRAFLLQNWLAYLIEQNSLLLEPPVPARKVGPGGKARKNPRKSCQLFLDQGLSPAGCTGALSCASLCSVPGGAMWVLRGRGVGGPGAESCSLPVLLPLGGSVAKEKSAGAAQLWAQRAAKARHESFVLLKYGGGEVQRGIFRLDAFRREG